MIWPDPTHQPTHPPTLPPNYTPTHRWRSLHRFQIFKQNWNISISSSAIEFWMIPGVPPGGGGGGCMRVGVVRGCTPPMCTCMCMHARAHMCIWHREFPGFPQIQWGRPFAWNYHVYHAHMCVSACACMCVGGIPQPPPTPIHPPPHPQSHREPKTPKFNKS